MPTITEFYSQDHDRLDRHFSEFQKLKRSDFPAAKENFKAFLKGLQRHIVWEEEILFPIFEKQAGMRDSGPTAVMRLEHRQIKACLDALHDKVRAADPDCDAQEKALLSVLGEHNMKEEHILYPAIDSFVGAPGLAAVKAAMDAVPEERFAACCSGHKD